MPLHPQAQQWTETLPPGTEAEDTVQLSLLPNANTVPTHDRAGAKKQRESLGALH